MRPRRTRQRKFEPEIATEAERSPSGGCSVSYVSSTKTLWLDRIYIITALIAPSLAKVSGTCPARERGCQGNRGEGFNGSVPPALRDNR